MSGFSEAHKTRHVLIRGLPLNLPLLLLRILASRFELLLRFPRRTLADLHGRLILRGVRLPFLNQIRNRGIILLHQSELPDLLVF